MVIVIVRKMNRPDYALHWKSLDEDPRSKKDSGLIKRLISAQGQRELHLAISLPNKERLLLIKMQDDWDGDLTRFPLWNGVEIYIHLGEERPVRGKYLAIRQAENDSIEVFEALIADICDAILSIDSGQNIVKVIMNRLEKWRSFFHEKKQDGLSIEAQQGLFAELYFLQKILTPVVGKSNALRGWTGPELMNRDFQFGNHAFEVKSTSAKLHHKIAIANERQLDSSGLGHLDLIFISVESAEGGEHSLPQLVWSIAETLKDDYSLRREFLDKLLEAGYLSVHEPNYRKTYLVRSITAYRVSEGFPRILERDLPPGVGDISYSIVLSACEEFKITMIEATKDLTIGKGTGDVI